MHKANPKSKRSKRRSNRKFEGSRPMRRAKKELEARQKDYSDKHATDRGYTKPGAINHW